MFKKNETALDSIIKEKKIRQEYELFLNVETNTSPTALNRDIISKISSLLNPSPEMIFLKLALIHCLIGLFSLYFCHQFEMNPFTSEGIISAWMMESWGHSACMFACGVLFMSLSFLGAGAVLNYDELRVFNKNSILHSFSLIALSLATFYLAGADLGTFFTIIWLLGAGIGSSFAFHTIHFFRKKAI